MKKSLRKTLAVMLMILLILPMLSSCKKKAEVDTGEESFVAYEIVAEEADESSEPVEESKEEVEESSEVSEPEKKQEPEFINPLTGEEVNRDYTNDRAYVAMCNNIEVSMPHCGVSQADLIMEMMDESGVTRFMVFFTDPTEVEKIGSIRSARIYNVETALGYDAFLTHCGGSDEAERAIYNYGMADIDGMYWEDGVTFYRDPSRQAHGIEHSMFCVGEEIIEVARDEYEYRMEHEEGYDGTYGMIFSENAVDQCEETANQIHVQYEGFKTTDFTYNADTNAYTMYQYGDEYSDDGEYGIPFANVINMYADTWIQGDGVHLSIDFDEGGEGTFFTGGKAVDILWYKDGVYDTFHFTLTDGTPLEFSVGKTFICVNQTGGYGYQGSCEWE